jgi:hypothetical protein
MMISGEHEEGMTQNHNLAEYHVPVNADVRDIDVIFVEKHDSIVNPLGVKGLGEIGLVDQRGISHDGQPVLLDLLNIACPT